MNERVFVVDACRTPIGKVGGGLSKFSEVEILATVVNALMERISDEIVPEDFIVGCCFCQEERNMAKKALMKTSLSYSTPAVTVNRTCASSMEALVQGYYRILAGDAEVVLVGGVENMSSNPSVMKMNVQNMRKFIREGQPAISLDCDELSLLDSIGAAVDIMARRNEITKEEQDRYALGSFHKAESAWEEGRFSDEVIPFYGADGEKIAKDENVEELFRMEKQQLKEGKPLYFRDGSLTKYNVSPISDGAVVMMLISERVKREYGVSVLAEIVGSSVVGVPPSEIGIAAAKAYIHLLQKTCLEQKSIGMIECNEAFAAQVLECSRYAQWDEKILNISGGSLALGHPLGCSGLRICTTLIYGMRRQNVKYGVATMCAGGGMGQAVLFRRDEEWD